MSSPTHKIPLTDATALLQQVRDGLDPTDVAAAVRARADECRELNVFIDPALPGLDTRAAEAADGPLRGLPIVVKDIIDVAGLPTSGGTPALLGRTVSTDAPVIATLRSAGAVVVGKNTLHELSFGITSNNACTGPARNPVEPQRIPGGSSGGTAAAVAAGIAPVGIAADTGGSSRIPAALCGIVGFRPSAGRYNGQGLLPISATRDTAGVVAHSVSDVRLVDSFLSPVHEQDCEAVDLGQIRLGIPTDYWRDLHPEVDRVCGAVRDRIAAAGVQLVDVDLSAMTALSDEIGIPICLYEFPRDLAAYLARESDGITVEQVVAGIASPDVKAIGEAALSRPVDEVAYAGLLQAQQQLMDDYAALLREHRLDGLLFPTTPLPAAPIGDDETTDLNGQQVPTFPTFIRHANLAGVAGHPGISLPAGHTEAGLPLGIEIDGHRHDDRALLCLAAALEAAIR